MHRVTRAAPPPQLRSRNCDWRCCGSSSSVLPTSERLFAVDGVTHVYESNDDPGQIVERMLPAVGREADARAQHEAGIHDWEEVRLADDLDDARANVFQTLHKTSRHQLILMREH